MAVTPIASKYCCITIQQMLEDIVGQENAPQNLVLETNGFVNAVMSDANTAGFEQVQTRDRRGKALPGVGNRTVEISYPVRQCGAVVDAPAGLCDTPAADVDDIAYSGVSVDCVKSNSLRINLQDFRQLCEEPSDRQQRRVMDKIRDLKKAVNDDLIAKYIAGLGNYFSEIGDPLVNSGVAPKTLLPFNTAFQPNAMAFFPLTRDYKRNGWGRQPIMVGGNTIENYVNPLTRSVFSANQEGRNNSNVSVPNFWADYQVDQVFADGLEHLLSWVPGYTQMTEWFQYEQGSAYEQIKEDYQKVVMTMDGFSFDFTFKYDECGDFVVLTFTKYYDLFKIPDESLASACGQVSNGCLQWLIDCGDLDCNYSKL